MNLRDALKNNLIWGTTTEDVPIHKIQFNSNKVKTGDLFVAIPGKEANGHDFMKQAVQAGAVVLVGEAADPNIEQSIPYYQVSNARLALAQIASCYYREPSNRHTMIGITGTNGKTTTAHLLYEVLKTAEISCSLIGSVCQRINGNEFDSAQTTPDALQLHQWLDMSQDQVVIMEVSSHGIDQERTSGIDFDFAIFTNLTHDHLDYHHSLERYFATKARLFQQIKGQGEAVVFSGNSWGRKLSEQLLTSRTPVRTYGNSLDDFIRISRVVSESPLEFEICEDQHNFYRVKLPLSGLYNAHNALAAWTTARRIGVDTKLLYKLFVRFLAFLVDLKSMLILPGQNVLSTTLILLMVSIIF